MSKTIFETGSLLQVILWRGLAHEMPISVSSKLTEPNHVLTSSMQPPSQILSGPSTNDLLR